MAYAQVLEHLQTNLQLAYRQALDADQQLNALQQAGHGKFQHIFKEDQGFTTKSNRFSPYVKELAGIFAELQLGIDSLPTPPTATISHLVSQLGLLLETLQAFKQAQRKSQSSN